MPEQNNEHNEEYVEVELDLAAAANELREHEPRPGGVLAQYNRRYDELDRAAREQAEHGWRWQPPRVNADEFAQFWDNLARVARGQPAVDAAGHLHRVQYNEFIEPVNAGNGDEVNVVVEQGQARAEVVRGRRPRGPVLRGDADLAPRVHAEHIELRFEAPAYPQTEYCDWGRCDLYIGSEPAAQTYDAVAITTQENKTHVRFRLTGNFLLGLMMAAGVPKRHITENGVLYAARQVLFPGGDDAKVPVPVLTVVMHKDPLHLRHIKLREVSWNRRLPPADIGVYDLVVRGFVKSPKEMLNAKGK